MLHHILRFSCFLQQQTFCAPKYPSKRRSRRPANRMTPGAGLTPGKIPEELSPNCWPVFAYHFNQEQAQSCGRVPTCVLCGRKVQVFAHILPLRQRGLSQSASIGPCLRDCFDSGIVFLKTCTYVSVGT